jgi:hypothetical protein
MGKILKILPSRTAVKVLAIMGLPQDHINYWSAPNDAVSGRGE